MHVAEPRSRAGTVCAYCAEPVLTGCERPEHALPAALRASIRVWTVCDPCNTWAGQEVDQPFLDDPFIRELRSRHDVRDPRHPYRRVESPLAHGFTAEGVHVAADKTWTPRIVSGRIVDHEDGSVDIIAGDQVEADRLAERVRKRAEAEGKTATFGDWRVVNDHPRISGQLQVRPWRWRRAIAKAALATASAAFDEQWRLGDDAARLRDWMRDPKALPHAHCPMSPLTGAVLAVAVPAPSNAIFFTRSGFAVVANVVLLGEYLFQLVVDESGRDAPEVAWLTDSRRPTGNSTVTYSELTSGYAAHQLEKVRDITGDR